MEHKIVPEAMAEMDPVIVGTMESVINWVLLYVDDMADGGGLIEVGGDNRNILMLLSCCTVLCMMYDTRICYVFNETTVMRLSIHTVCKSYPRRNPTTWRRVYVRIFPFVHPLTIFVCNFVR